MPGWDRFHSHCPTCQARNVQRAAPATPCSTCGTALEVRREEAVLDLEVQSAACPRLFLDVTVRHAVPGSVARLAAAASHDGAVNREAEADKRMRYPDGSTPWKAVPLAVETFGRHGPAALKHLRQLARSQAARLQDGAQAAASSLMLRWGARLSVALHRANAANVRSALGAAEAGCLDPF